jgi:hypothetical protein
VVIQVERFTLQLVGEPGPVPASCRSEFRRVVLQLVVRAMRVERMVASLREFMKLDREPPTFRQQRSEGCSTEDCENVP